jgi:hypothetical protein
VKRRTKPVSKRNAGPRRPQLQPIDRRGWREAVRAAESVREPLPAEAQPPPERLAG